jgi:lipopolysaccharide/colanic/teichoic acid biosynthesis glycosyltransferase
MLAEERSATTARRPAGGLAYRVTKETVDLTLSLLSLVVVLPVLIVLCLAIALTSPGWPLYRQWRSGLHGRPFRILKLRTMVAGADRLGPGLTEDGDPRITRVGRFVRRWSLDELPQVLNVLAGHMSLVGPRPEICSLVETYTPEQREVLLVRPGLTGWAQVSGRDDLGMAEKLRLERDYVSGRSLGWDARILVRTIPVVASGVGIKR